MAWLKRSLWIALVLGLVAAVAYANRPKPLGVEVARVARGPLRITVDEDGRTRVKDRYVITAPVGGRLVRIALRPGDDVAPGAVVARIVPGESPLLDARARAESAARVRASAAALAQARATASRARAAVEFARREAARQRTLVAQQAAAAHALEVAEFDARSRAEDLASAEFGVQVAAHQLETARLALSRAQGDAAARGEQWEIRAPVAGRVLRVIRESEGVVAAGAELLELGDPAALEVVVDVLTVDAVRVRPGARVRIERWGGDGALRGHVRTVEPSAFTRVSALGVEEQRVNVVIDRDDPPAAWRAVGDGYRVEARIVVWDSPAALQVPASALLRHDGAWAVFVVEGGVARRRRIEVGQRSGLEAEVTRGLREGERVIAHPSDRVDEGVAVAALPAPGDGGGAR